jgi:hypothetical protein
MKKLIISLGLTFALSSYAAEGHQARGVPNMSGAWIGSVGWTDPVRGVSGSCNDVQVWIEHDTKYFTALDSEVFGENVDCATGWSANPGAFYYRFEEGGSVFANNWLVGNITENELHLNSDRPVRHFKKLPSGELEFSAVVDYTFNPGWGKIEFHGILAPR